MSALTKATMVAGTLDTSTSLTQDLIKLSITPNDPVAQAQVNADLQNLGAAATLLIPGVATITLGTAVDAVGNRCKMKNGP